jgi:hypothetical protein
VHSGDVADDAQTAPESRVDLGAPSLHPKAVVAVANDIGDERVEDHGYLDRAATMSFRAWSLLSSGC